MAHLRSDAAFSVCPFCAANRTWIEHAPISQKCERTHAPQKKSILLDHLVGLRDVVYEDGTRRSNRQIAISELDPVDADASARAILEAQDRKIAAISGRPSGFIKSITRSARR